MLFSWPRLVNLSHPPWLMEIFGWSKSCFGSIISHLFLSFLVIFLLFSTLSLLPSFQLESISCYSCNVVHGCSLYLCHVSVHYFSILQTIFPWFQGNVSDIHCSFLFTGKREWFQTQPSLSVLTTPIFLTSCEVCNCCYYTNRSLSHIFSYFCFCKDFYRHIPSSSILTQL